MRNDQVSTKSPKKGKAYDDNLQSQHGPWGQDQERPGPFGGKNK